MVDFVGELFRRQAAKKSQAAFRSGLEEITQKGFDDQGKPLEGLPPVMVTPRVAAAANELFAASPALGTQFLQQSLAARHTRNQNAESRKVQWAQLDQQQAAFDQRERALDQTILQFQRSGNPVFQRQLAQAKDLGAVYVPDPQNNGVWTRTAAPGTQEWRDLTDGATSARQAVDSLDELKFSVSQFGVIEDPASRRGAAQESMRTQLMFHAKNATQAGALDQGLLDQMEKVFGSSSSMKQFLLGSDASALARLNQSSQLFDNAMERAGTATRLITGWDGRGAFEETRQRTRLLRNVFFPAQIQRIQQQGGGQVPTEAQRALEGQRFVPENVQPFLNRGIEKARELGNVAADQLGTLASGLLGFAVGRGFR